MAGEVETDLELSRRGRLLSLWAGIFVAPIAALAHQQVNYMLVPWACAEGTRLPLFLVTLVSLGVAAGGGLVAWRNWERAGREWPTEAAGAAPRSRFMAAVGLLLSGLLALVIVAQGIASLFLDPCQL